MKEMSRHRSNVYGHGRPTGDGAISLLSGLTRIAPLLHRASPSPRVVGAGDERIGIGSWHGTANHGNLCPNREYSIGLRGNQSARTGGGLPGRGLTLTDHLADLEVSGPGGEGMGWGCLGF